MRKFRRKIQLSITLPLKWYFQRMRVVESIIYPTPKELLSQLDAVKLEQPQSARSDKERYQYLLGQQAILEQLLYGNDTPRTES